MADHKLDTTGKADGEITSLSGEWGEIARHAAITSIDSFTNTYYLEVGGERVDVFVVRGPEGPYLHTDASGEGPNQLLDLPDS